MDVAKQIDEESGSLHDALDAVERELRRVLTSSSPAASSAEEVRALQKAKRDVENLIHLVYACKIEEECLELSRYLEMSVVDRILLLFSKKFGETLQSSSTSSRDESLLLQWTPERILEILKRDLLPMYKSLPPALAMVDWIAGLKAFVVLCSTRLDPRVGRLILTSELIFPSRLDGKLAILECVDGVIYSPDLSRALSSENDVLAHLESWLELVPPPDPPAEVIFKDNFAKLRKQLMYVREDLRCSRLAREKFSRVGDDEEVVTPRDLRRMREGSGARRRLFLDELSTGFVRAATARTDNPTHLASQANEAIDSIVREIFPAIFPSTETSDGGGGVVSSTSRRTEIYLITTIFSKLLIFILNSSRVEKGDIETLIEAARYRLSRHDDVEENVVRGSRDARDEIEAASSYSAISTSMGTCVYSAIAEVLMEGAEMGVAERALEAWSASSNKHSNSAREKEEIERVRGLLSLFRTFIRVSNANPHASGSPPRTATDFVELLDFWEKGKEEEALQRLISMLRENDSSSISSSARKKDPPVFAVVLRACDDAGLKTRSAKRSRTLGNLLDFLSSTTGREEEVEIVAEKLIREEQERLSASRDSPNSIIEEDSGAWRVLVRDSVGKAREALALCPAAEMGSVLPSLLATSTHHNGMKFTSIFEIVFLDEETRGEFVGTWVGREEDGGEAEERGIIVNLAMEKCERGNVEFARGVLRGMLSHPSFAVDDDISLIEGWKNASESVGKLGEACVRLISARGGGDRVAKEEKRKSDEDDALADPFDSGHEMGSEPSVGNFLLATSSNNEDNNLSRPIASSSALEEWTRFSGFVLGATFANSAITARLEWLANEETKQKADPHESFLKRRVLDNPRVVMMSNDSIAAAPPPLFSLPTLPPPLLLDFLFRVRKLGFNHLKEYAVLMEILELVYKAGNLQFPDEIHKRKLVAWRLSDCVVASEFSPVFPFLCGFPEIDSETFKFTRFSAPTRRFGDTMTRDEAISRLVASVDGAKGDVVKTISMISSLCDIEDKKARVRPSEILKRVLLRALSLDPIVDTNANLDVEEEEEERGGKFGMRTVVERRIKPFLTKLVPRDMRDFLETIACRGGRGGLGYEMRGELVAFVKTAVESGEYKTKEGEETEREALVTSISTCLHHLNFLRSNLKSRSLSKRFDAIMSGIPPRENDPLFSSRIVEGVTRFLLMSVRGSQDDAEAEETTRKWVRDLVIPVTENLSLSPAGVLESVLFGGFLEEETIPGAVGYALVDGFVSAFSPLARAEYWTGVMERLGSIATTTTTASNSSARRKSLTEAMQRALKETGLLTTSEALEMEMRAIFSTVSKRNPNGGLSDAEIASYLMTLDSSPNSNGVLRSLLETFAARRDEDEMIWQRYPLTLKSVIIKTEESQGDDMQANGAYAIVRSMIIEENVESEILDRLPTTPRRRIRFLQRSPRFQGLLRRRMPGLVLDWIHGGDVSVGLLVSALDVLCAAEEGDGGGKLGEILVEISERLPPDTLNGFVDSVVENHVKRISSPDGGREDVVGYNNTYLSPLSVVLRTPPRSELSHRLLVRLRRPDRHLLDRGAHQDLLEKAFLRGWESKLSRGESSDDATLKRIKVRLGEI